MSMTRAVVMFIAIVAPLSAATSSGSAVAPRCKGSQSCQHDSGPRTGGVLLQTVTDKDGVDVKDLGVAKTAAVAATSSKGMPLKGRVTGLETAIGELQTRMAALQTEVSGTADIEAAASLGLPEFPMAGLEVPKLKGEPAKKDHTESLLSEASTDSDADFAKLESELSDSSSWPSTSAGSAPAKDHHSHVGRRATSELSLAESSVSEEAHREGALKDRVAASEATVATLKSKMQTLENDVMGNSLSRASLLQEGAAGSSLKSRILSLEEEVDSLRSRASSLEHTVTG